MQGRSIFGEADDNAQARASWARGLLMTAGAILMGYAVLVHDSSVGSRSTPLPGLPSELPARDGGEARVFNLHAGLIGLKLTIVGAALFVGGAALARRSPSTKD